jgi:hypothetical protein
MIMGVLKGINLSAQHPDGVMYWDVSFEDGYLTILSPAAHNYGPIEDVITNMMKDAIDNSL